MEINVATALFPGVPQNKLLPPLTTNMTGWNNHNLKTQMYLFTFEFMRIFQCQLWSYFNHLKWRMRRFSLSGEVKSPVYKRSYSAPVSRDITPGQTHL